MSRASRLVKQSQTSQGQSVPQVSSATTTSPELGQQGVPQMPRGQMPIEEVFKMMWARMNFLENALKDRPVINADGEEVVGATTVADLQNQVNQVIQTQQAPPSFDQSVLDEIRETLVEHGSKITTLAQEVGSIKKTMSETIGNFNNSMQAVGADMTEMNNKYTQMNNFLMEIQTTQITVNNQILKHYNDNYSDLIETQITQSADEKFNAKDGQEVATATETATETTETVTETVAKTVADVIANADAAEAADAADTSDDVETTTTETAQTETVATETSTPKKTNNVTFNIE